MRRFLLALSLSFVACASAQESPEATETVFTLGGITVDKAAKTVRFPATVQLESGPLEYLLVTEAGKTHESLLATKVSPFKIHVAMLLLGARPAREIKEPPPEQLNATNLKNAPELKGDKVNILVTWTANGKEQQIHAQEWVHNRLTQTSMTPGPWIYTSSALFKGTFLAQKEGSIIALVTDPVALINNPRPGHTDDSVWTVQKGQVPAANTPVEIIFQLLPAPSSPTQTSPK